MDCLHQLNGCLFNFDIVRNSLTALLPITICSSTIDVLCKILEQMIYSIPEK